MNALKPRPPFQVLIMSEESRLGREMVDTMGALKQLVTVGVRVFYYMTDSERTLDSPIEKAMMALETFGAELEREKARQRTADAMAHKARAGHVTGGRVFGYDNVEVLGEPDSHGRRPRLHVERRINEREAAVVRRIFELCAQGHGMKQITYQLNAAGAVCPRPQQGRPAGWSPSSIRSMLYRPLYRGELVWNRSRKRDQWGQVRPHARPDAEWLRQPAPELRIVADEQWEAAHARLGGSPGPVSTRHRWAVVGASGTRDRVEVSAGRVGDVRGVWWGPVRAEPEPRPTPRLLLCCAPRITRGGIMSAPTPTNCRWRP